MTPTKSCPVVLRINNEIEILAFQHPIAGHQLVKGTIELGEPPEKTALRELAEEAGISGAKIVSNMGLWDSGYQNQVWSFHLCITNQETPDKWTHHTSDDGGHDFNFFWHPLSEPANAEWHEVFQGALSFIRTALTSDSSRSLRSLGTG